MTSATLKKLREHGATGPVYGALVASLPADYSDDAPISNEHIQKHCGVDFALWSLRTQGDDGRKIAADVERRGRPAPQGGAGMNRPAPGIAGFCFIFAALCVAVAYGQHVLLVKGPAIREWLLSAATPQTSAAIVACWFVVLAAVLIGRRK